MARALPAARTTTWWWRRGASRSTPLGRERLGRPLPWCVLRPGPFDRYKPRAARKRGLGHALRRALGACDLIVAHNFPAHALGHGGRAAHARHARGLVLRGAEHALSRRRDDAALHGRARRSRAPSVAAQTWQASSRASARATRAARGARSIAKLDREAAARVDLTLGTAPSRRAPPRACTAVRALPCLLGLPEPARAGPARRAVRRVGDVGDAQERVRLPRGDPPRRARARCARPARARGGPARRGVRAPDRGALAATTSCGARAGCRTPI